MGSFSITTCFFQIVNVPVSSLLYLLFAFVSHIVGNVTEVVSLLLIFPVILAWIVLSASRAYMKGEVNELHRRLVCGC